MKKLIITALILISTFLRADTIEEGYHPIEQYKEITNCSDFPDITIIAFVGCVSGSIDPYVVTDGTILEKDYKFNSLYLIAYKTQEFNDAGGISSFDFEQVVRDNAIKDVFGTWSKQISDDNVIEGEHVYYKITDVNGLRVKIEFDKIVFSFNNGTADKTVTF